MKRALFALLVVAPGCFDDGWHEGDPVDRAVTGVRLVPSLDDSRLAFTLEPRKIHRDEHGVLVLGHSTTLVGPTIAVEGAAPFATLAVGTSIAATGATRLWLLQSELAYWEHSFPSAPPPGAPLVLGTPIDRATLAIGAPVMFDPPIDAPVMLGDVLFDLPVSGTSDVARDVVIRRRAFDGTATVVHTGRGFGVATCTRGDGFVIAYTREGGALSLVSVRDDGAGDFAIRETTVEAFAFDPLAIACSDHAAHVALVVPSGVALVDVTTGEVKLTVEGVRPPMVVSRDGSALVAARTTDRMLVAATAAGATPLGQIVAKSGAPPARAGDLAMFELEAALVVVDVGRGTVGTVIPAIRMTMYPYEMVAWRDRFIVQLSTCCETDYEDHIEQLLLVDATTATQLPLPSSRYSPKLLPSGSRLYVRSYDTNTDDAQARLSAIDPAADALLSEEPLPLCDETAVLEERGCR